MNDQAVFSIPIIPNGSPEKRFPFPVVTLDCTRKRFSNRKGKRKHENKIVRRRPCCERDHDCSSEPRRCSRSDRGISQRRSCTQCPGRSRSDATRRCFIVPFDADAVIRQQTVLFRPTPFFVWHASVTILRYWQPFYSSRGSFMRSGPYTVATIPQRNRLTPFANRRNPTVTRVWNQRNIGTQFRNGNNLRNANNLRNMKQSSTGVTGKNTFSLRAQGIGIAIGTAIATTGGMVTDALSLMDRG